MRIYIVYESSFDTVKPRERDAEPYIRLVTIDKNKAYDKLDELKKKYKGIYYEDEMYFDEEFFTYTSASGREYGMVGVLEKELE